MEAKEWTYTDKSEWPDGVWKTEPDKVQWLDAATGLPCLIVRSPTGALCGYVGVGPDHPCFEKEYAIPDVDVHWGLTFAGHCAPGEPEHGICHIWEGDVKRWWFGFDCAHSRDYCPAYGSFSPIMDGYYRDIAFVKRETIKLAKQLAEKTN